MIVITIDGGLVQGVSSDDQTLVGQEVVVINYDAEGAEAGEVVAVPQDQGKTEEATIGRHEIGVLYEPVAKFLQESQ
jgi:hypothetical protein